MAAPWGEIAKLIIKASDNINRGVENAATDNADVAQNTNPAQTTVNTDSSGNAQSVVYKGYEPSEQKSETPDTGINAGGILQTVTDIKGENDPEDTSKTEEEKNEFVTMSDSKLKNKITMSESFIKDKDNKNEVYNFNKMTDAEKSEFDKTYSDERLKKIFGDKCNNDLIKSFSKINAIGFKYNDKAHELYGEEVGVDDDYHVGIKAQELAENPVTENCVKQDENGFLGVDTKELTMANSAVLSEICKRIEALEKVLGLEAK